MPNPVPVRKLPQAATVTRQKGPVAVADSWMLLMLFLRHTAGGHSRAWGTPGADPGPPGWVLPGEKWFDQHLWARPGCSTWTAVPM